MATVLQFSSKGPDRNMGPEESIEQELTPSLQDQLTEARRELDEFSNVVAIGGNTDVALRRAALEDRVHDLEQRLLDGQAMDGGTDELTEGDIQDFIRTAAVAEDTASADALRSQIQLSRVQLQRLRTELNSFLQKIHAPGNRGQVRQFEKRLRRLQEQEIPALENRIETLELDEQVLLFDAMSLSIDADDNHLPVLESEVVADDAIEVADNGLETAVEGILDTEINTDPEEAVLESEVVPTPEPTQSKLDTLRSMLTEREAALVQAKRNGLVNNHVIESEIAALQQTIAAEDTISVPDRPVMLADRKHVAAKRARANGLNDTQVERAVAAEEHKYRRDMRLQAQKRTSAPRNTVIASRSRQQSLQERLFGTRSVSTSRMTRIAVASAVAAASLVGIIGSKKAPVPTPDATIAANHLRMDAPPAPPAHVVPDTPASAPVEDTDSDALLTHEQEHAVVTELPADENLDMTLGELDGVDFGVEEADPSHAVAPEPATAELTPEDLAPDPVDEPVRTVENTAPNAATVPVNEDVFTGTVVIAGTEVASATIADEEETCEDAAVREAPQKKQFDYALLAPRIEPPVQRAHVPSVNERIARGTTAHDSIDLVHNTIEGVRLGKQKVEERTMRAIAYAESAGGRYTINKNAHGRGIDRGLFQINDGWVTNKWRYHRNGTEDSVWRGVQTIIANHTGKNLSLYEKKQALLEDTVLNEKVAYYLASHRGYQTWSSYAHRSRQYRKAQRMPLSRLEAATEVMTMFTSSDDTQRIAQDSQENDQPHT